MERIKPIWLILIGALLLVMGVGGALVSMLDLFGVSVSNFQEWDESLSEVGFAPFAMPVTKNEVFAPAFEVETTLVPRVTRTPAEILQGSPAPEASNNHELETVEATRRRPFVIPSRLIIPSIGLDAQIVPSKPKDIRIGGDTYEQWQAPDKFAVGWHTTSAVLGQEGNTVLNGHHNIEGKVFENLHMVEPGDTIFIMGGLFQFEYLVVNVMILPERNVDVNTRLENARWILPSTDERVTLVTCWPAWTNTHRLVVVAQPVGEPIELEVTPTLLSEVP